MAAVTIRQIAKAVQLDVSTVSRILSGRGEENRIPENTVARVQAVAKTMGYQPNVYARYLRTRRTHTIGLSIS